jgi:hypothetical protein
LSTIKPNGHAVIKQGDFTGDAVTLPISTSHYDDVKDATGFDPEQAKQQTAEFEAVLETLSDSLRQAVADTLSTPSVAKRGPRKRKGVSA